MIGILDDAPLRSEREAQHVGEAKLRPFRRGRLMRRLEDLVTAQVAVCRDPHPTLHCERSCDRCASVPLVDAPVRIGEPDRPEPQCAAACPLEPGRRSSRKQNKDSCVLLLLEWSLAGYPGTRWALASR